MENWVQRAPLVLSWLCVPDDSNRTVEYCAIGLPCHSVSGIMSPVLAYVIAVIVVYLAWVFMVVIFPWAVKTFYKWFRREVLKGIDDG